MKFPDVFADSARTSPEEWLYVARVGAWVRVFLWSLSLLEVQYRVEYGALSHILNNLYVLALLVPNLLVLRLRRGSTVNPMWLFGLSLLDVMAISFSVSLSGGFSSPYVPAYHIAVALFAWVFAAPRLVVAWTTLVVVVYSLLSVFVAPGLDIAVREERYVFYQVGALYAVAGAVSLIMSFERDRWFKGVERERELHRQRTELSQRIHDTSAQWAYVIGLGLEGAMKRVDGSDEELIERLRRLGELSRSAMWDLRHPIDGGRIFRGERLADVLEAHAATFRAVTSVAAEFVCYGTEPPMPVIERSLLFSIVHNALTNVVRHADAGKVVVEFDCTGQELKLSVLDDGVGLPPGYERNGHGFSNMRSDAERMGGRLEVGPGLDGRGACVACLVPVGILKEGD